VENEAVSIAEPPNDQQIGEVLPAAGFELPERIREEIGRCSKTSHSSSKDIAYLWVHVTGRATEGGCHGGTPSLSLQDWLNVVDEAASLGVNWLVISVGSKLADFPDVWQVCDWAQSVHGMTVGIHCAENSLSDEDVEAIQQLEGSLTRLLVPKRDVEKLRYLEETGILVREANPRPGEQQTPCEKPTRMVFVNPQGHLYTCGLVEGMEEYHLGNVFNGTLDAILHNASLPHAISDQVPRNGHGCDGCPPIMADFFENVRKP
jgi:radical SAM protein with 4Fe4S-binding SPASM domain